MGGFVLLYNRVMATQIYKSGTVTTLDGQRLYLTPLKIKYLRQFMTAYAEVGKAEGQIEVLSALAECALISMQQYCPDIRTLEDLEDRINLPTIYKIINIAGGVSADPNEPADTSETKDNGSDEAKGSSWDELDLAKLEAEVFLLGIWKDYEELETSLSMPELVATLESKREIDYQEKKFLAAIQGVDLDESTGQKEANPQSKWEEMKARVFSGGAATNSNDIVSLQGPSAQKAGFGIGMGLDYVKLG